MTDGTLVCGGCGHRFPVEQLHPIGYSRYRCELCWSRQT